MAEKFLSVVVPAYNCLDTLGNVLSSIAVQQNNNEIEVVIADDCSTDDYTNMINYYSTILSIKYIKLDKNSGPGVARQVGLDNATGEWITFIDADDTMAYGAYVNVKEVLTQQDPDMLITDFFEQRDDYKSFVPHQNDTVWVHGKYFKHKFLLDNNIKFHPTLRTHEDIYFNHLVLNTSDKVRVANILTYIWNFQPNSITRKVYNDCHIYIEEYLGDYIEATMGPCKKLIDENPAKYKAKLENLVMMHPLYLYFYVQSFKYNLPDKWYKDNIKKVKQVLDLAEKWYSAGPNEIYQYVKKSNVYGMIRQACERGVGNFIEQQTFLDFLEECKNA